jgi:hypothetical protein
MTLRLVGNLASSVAWENPPDSPHRTVRRRADEPRPALFNKLLNIHRQLPAEPEQQFSRRRPPGNGV